MAEPAAIRFTNPPAVAPPLGHYSHLAVVPAGARLLVLAGQTGHAPDGSLPESAEAQYRGALSYLLAILASEGAGPGHIVKLNTWLTAPMELSVVRAARQELLGAAAPPSTLAYVAGLALPEIKVEIEAWAAIPG
jgi:enamine deaminase RidA (YjgF/YER057c/UK114 family)